MSILALILIYHYYSSSNKGKLQYSKPNKNAKEKCLNIILNNLAVQYMQMHLCGYSDICI